MSNRPQMPWSGGFLAGTISCTTTRLSPRRRCLSTNRPQAIGSSASRSAMWSLRRMYGTRTSCSMRSRSVRYVLSMTSTTRPGCVVMASRTGRRRMERRRSRALMRGRCATSRSLWTATGAWILWRRGFPPPRQGGAGGFFALASHRQGRSARRQRFKVLNATSSTVPA